MKTTATFLFAVLVLVVAAGFAGAATYEYVKADSEESTTSTSYVTRTTLTFTPSEVDDWVVISTADVQGQSVGYSSFVRLQVDGTTEADMAHRAKDASDWFPFSTSKVLSSLSASQHTITLQYMTQNASAYCKLRNARIIAIKKSDLEINSGSGYDGDTLQPVTDAYVTYASTVFTPATSGNYLLVFSAEFRSPLDANTFLRGSADSTVLDEYESRIRRYDCVHTWASYKVVTLDATEHTVALDAKKEVDPDNHYIRRCRVAAIRLDGVFAGAVSADSDGESSTSETTFQQKLTKSWTPSTAGNWLLLASGSMQYSSTDASEGQQAQLNDSTTLFAQSREPVATTMWMCFAGADLVNLTASSQTVDVDYRAELGTDTAKIQYVHFAGLPLDETGGPAPLIITTTSLDEGAVGVAYSDTLAATGGVAPYTWSIISGSLPAGLSLNSSTGEISGTPTTGETANFTAQVIDSQEPADSDTKALSITIYADLEITTTSLPDGTEGVAYSQTLAATGGKTPYTWSIVSGSLPAGLSLNSATGEISGTPTTAGTSNFTAEAEDSQSTPDTDTQALSITIDPGPLTILTTSLPNGKVNTAYSETLVATGGVTPYTWSIDSGSLPAGLSLNSSTGEISGTPTAEQTANFTAKVTDSATPTPDTDTQALSITIDPEGPGSTYEIGPGKTYETISSFPWEDLSAGDTVKIYYKATPYKEKFGVFSAGTQANPITVQGVPGGGGELPVIDGDGAVSRSSVYLDYWSENRQVIKVGGSTIPLSDPDNPPMYVVIENLEAKSGRDPYTFTDGDGNPGAYTTNASSIRVECGEYITVRNCTLHDSGNNFLTSGSSKEITFEGNYVYDGGYGPPEHNIYTESHGITFQYNHCEPLRTSGTSNEGINLKDRSARTCVRYNWIEGGVRQVNLVESYDYQTIRDYPGYGTEDRVYGNILIMHADSNGNENFLYGGDMGGSYEQYYRTGPLKAYNNTVISRRTDNTRLIRLKTSAQSADLFNNIWHVPAGTAYVLSSAIGTCSTSHNWFQEGYFLTGATEDGTNISGTAPGFIDYSGEDFHLASDSDCIDAGMDIPSELLPTYDVTEQYVKHQESESRPSDATMDIGAYEYDSGGPAPLEITTTSLEDGVVGEAYSQTLQATGGVTPYSWAVISGSLPAGLSLASSTGEISGTPTTAQTANFTVEVTDSDSPPSTDQQALSIDIYEDLVITTTTLPDGDIGVPYSQTLAATGGLTPYAWAIITGVLPDGLSLNSSTGQISGTPTTAETQIFTVEVTDSANPADTDQKSLSITINAEDLVITTTSLDDGVVGEAYSQTLQATGGVTPYSWAVVSGSLPAGLSLNSSTGEISGTPTSAGTSNFTVEVTDSQAIPDTDQQALSIDVYDDLVITTTTLDDGVVSEAYSQTLAATGGLTPYSWAVVSGSLPAGLSLSSSTGEISGTPTTAETANFTVEVTDSANPGDSDQQALSIDIYDDLVITTSSLPDGTVGVAYSQTLAATGGLTPYSWAVVSGSLPAGLSLNSSTGEISGTPTTQETANFTVEVTDSQGVPDSDQQALSITINPAADPLVITTTSLPDGTKKQPYSATLQATGGVTPYTWSIVAGALPNGLSLNSSTGEISGTCRKSGTFNFTARVEDSQEPADFDEKALSITVDN